MSRLYVSSENISKGRIVINEPRQLHHIRDVLRVKENDKMIIFDGEGNEYLGVIKQIGAKLITLDIEKKMGSLPKNRPQITLACCLTKGRKMDDIVDKLTQLGVKEFIPLESERTVVKWDEIKFAKHLSRWETIVLNASQQSGRSELMSLGSRRKFKELVCEKSNYGLKLIPTLGVAAKDIKDILNRSRSQSILIAVGPEGDFTQEEIKFSESFGFRPVSLGDSVLRVETAALAVVSFIKLYADS